VDSIQDYGGVYNWGSNTAKAGGRFKTRGTYVPKMGDLMMMLWGKNHHHITIVTGVSNGMVNTIEGNTQVGLLKGVVAKISRPLNNKQIAGYGTGN